MPGGAVFNYGFLGGIMEFLGMVMFTIPGAKLFSVTYEDAVDLAKCMFFQFALLYLVILLLIGVSFPHHEMQWLVVCSLFCFGHITAVRLMCPPSDSLFYIYGLFWIDYITFIHFFSKLFLFSFVFVHMIYRMKSHFLCYCWV